MRYYDLLNYSHISNCKKANWLGYSWPNLFEEVPTRLWEYNQDLRGECEATLKFSFIVIYRQTLHPPDSTIPPSCVLILHSNDDLTSF